MASLYKVVYSSKSLGDIMQLVQATTPQNAWLAVQAAFPSTSNHGHEAKQPVSITEFFQTQSILVGS